MTVASIALHFLMNLRDLVFIWTFLLKLHFQRSLETKPNQKVFFLGSFWLLTHNFFSLPITVLVQAMLASNDILELLTGLNFKQRYYQVNLLKMLQSSYIFTKETTALYYWPQSQNSSWRSRFIHTWPTFLYDLYTSHQSNSSSLSFPPKPYRLC